jgi:hypothetical protein
VRIVSSDRTYLDYFQRICAIQKGLTNRFGLRLREGKCSALLQLGDGEPRTFGKDLPLPVDLETLPSYLRMIVENHLLNYPNSDLMDILTGRKSFREALDTPAKMEPKRMSAGRLERLKDAS